MSLDTANEAAEAPADAADSKMVRVWRAELNDNYCKQRRLDHPPVGYDGNGKLTFAKDAVSNPESYILWDTSRDAPPGFALKVAGKKTYILRRKVMGKSMLAKVGNFADFEKIQTARAKAAELALAMVATGQNPNVMAREQNAAEVTLKQAMLAYREHIVERTQRPAKPETLKVYDRVMRRHEEWKWADKKVREISTDDIKKKFKEISESYDDDGFVESNIRRSKNRITSTQSREVYVYLAGESMMRAGFGRMVKSQGGQMPKEMDDELARVRKVWSIGTLMSGPCDREGARYSPFLAVALSKGHRDLAVWMITKKRCKLGDLDPDTGSPCRELASPDLLEEVESEVQRISMRGDREIRAGKPGKGSIRV